MHFSIKSIQRRESNQSTIVVRSIHKSVYVLYSSFYGAECGGGPVGSTAKLVLVLILIQYVTNQLGLSLKIYHMIGAPPAFIEGLGLGGRASAA